VTFGTTHHYSVKAADAGGKKSVSSAKISGTPDAGSIVKFATNDSAIVYSPLIRDVSAARAKTIKLGEYFNAALENAPTKIVF
jgi:hypothetical protein